jgi:hypothetical protein
VVGIAVPVAAGTAVGQAGAERGGREGRLELRLLVVQELRWRGGHAAHWHLAMCARQRGRVAVAQERGGVDGETLKADQLLVGVARRATTCRGRRAVRLTLSPAAGVSARGVRLIVSQHALQAEPGQGERVLSSMLLLLLLMLVLRVYGGEFVGVQ